jgi:hypothetical protein
MVGQMRVRPVATAAAKMYQRDGICLNKIPFKKKSGHCVLRLVFGNVVDKKSLNTFRHDTNKSIECEAA